ncbi:MAG: hypothetical protein ACI9QL_004512, partial [Candidatus Omnitrophota bacterium]
SIGDEVDLKSHPLGRGGHCLQVRIHERLTTRETDHLIAFIPEYSQLLQQPVRGEHLTKPRPG